MVARWIAVQTKSRQEDWARVNVIAQGRPAFLPKLRPDHRDLSPRPSPLFPGYLFVQIVAQWYFLRGTFGVLRPVMAGEELAVIPDAAIDELIRKQGGDGLIAPPKRGFWFGQRVRVKSGAFAAETGSVEARVGRNRLRLWLGSFNIDIDERSVEAV
jgi:Transcription termination factor nusG